MTYYIDLTAEGGCCGILFTNPENRAVYVGTTVHTEAEALRDHFLAERFEKQCDFHFFFTEDTLPELYTVPKVEIGGYDSRGGLFAGSPDFGFRKEDALYYIDREGNCFRILTEGSSFPDMGMDWRERMVPTEEIEVFASRAEAEKKYRIWSWKELFKEGDL